MAGSSAPYLRWAVAVIRRWRDELADLLVGNELFETDEDTRREVFGRLDSAAETVAGLAAEEPGALSLEEAAAAVRTAVMERLFPWDRASPPLRPVLGPELTQHVRKRIADITAADPAGSPAAEQEPASLWAPELLRETRDRLAAGLAQARGLVSAAPYLGEPTRENFVESLDGLSAELAEAGPDDARTVLSLDLKLGRAIDLLHEKVLSEHRARLAEVERELDEWGTRLRKLEDRAWAIRENPLYGGRGAGTTGLAFLILSFSAVLFLDRPAALRIIPSLALLGALVWGLYNLQGTRLQEPYMEAVGKVKGLSIARKSLEDTWEGFAAREKAVRRRLRER
ncbi:MAG: hypothetical protein AB1645_02450 [Bacillota bacterium]|jgi:hypothetical protein